MARKKCSTGVLASLHLDLPEQETVEEFAGARTRKVSDPCKRWRQGLREIGPQILKDLDLSRVRLFTN